jgi:hypothetical protein
MEAQNKSWRLQETRAQSRFDKQEYNSSEHVRTQQMAKCFPRWRTNLHMMDRQVLEGRQKTRSKAVHSVAHDKNK